MAQFDTLKTHRRIKYLDFCKGLAIYLVCCGHFVQNISQGDSYMDNPLWKFIYSFHMPLFMILCGYFCKSSMLLNFLEILKKKFIALILPTLSFFLLIDTSIDFMKKGFPFVFSMDYLESYVETFWFLKCLFFCYLIVYFFKHLFKNDVIASLSSILLVTIIPQFNILHISFMLPFFWIGYFLMKVQSNINTHIIAFFLISIISFLCLYAFWDTKYTIYVLPIFPSLTYSGFMNIIIAIYRFMIGCMGSFSIIFGANILFNKSDNRFTSIVVKLGTYTLGIYILQTYFLEKLLQGLHIYINNPYNSFLSLLFSAFEIIICICAVLFLRKNRVTKLLFLGESK
jgi:fucose 4-O-acetylase-like acetyltransferase